MRDFVGGHGPIPAVAMVVGERPGEVELRVGRPFVGPAGLELNSYLNRAGLRRADLYVTNLVKTFAPGNLDPSPAEIKEWGGRLQEEIDQVQPRVIAAAGRFAARWLLRQPDLDMDQYHGLVFREYGRHHGVEPMTIVPCYHPAAGLHQPELAARSAWDFRQFGAAVDGEAEPWKPSGVTPRYRLLRSLGDMAEALPFDMGGHRNGGPRIAVDTEGNARHPYCLSLSPRPGEAWVILATDGDLLGGLDWWIKKSEAVVVLHNAMYDLEVLAAMGVYPERFEDTMVKAYNMSIEPQGLKALAFRHLGIRMQSYDDLTRPYRCKQMRRWLSNALTASEPLPKPEPLINEGTGKITRPQHVSLRLKNALGADEPWKAWGDVEAAVRAPIEALVGPPPVFDLAQVPLDKVVRYAGADADVTGQLDRQLPRSKVYPVDRDAISMFARMQQVGMLLDFDHLEALDARLEQKMGKIERQIAKLAGREINPRSVNQVSEWLFQDLKLRTRIKTKVGHEDSTGDKALEPLRSKHPGVPLILDYREAATIRSRFTYPLMEMADGAHRVHPNWRITRVITGRPSCTDPNLLAIPVRSEDGREVRAGFVASSGMVLGGADLNQIEMRYMAHESKDERLLDAYTRGADVHAENAADMFGVPLSAVEQYKHRDPAKRVGFGVITGITGQGLREQFELNGIAGWSEEACDNLINDYMKLHPGVRAYMDACYAEAEQRGYVEDRWGRRRYLPGIYSRQPRVKAEAQRASHSHKIQGGAAGLMKVAMARLWRKIQALWRAGVKVEPLLQVYDELVLEIEQESAEMVMAWVKGVLEDWPWMRVPVLASASIGQNWKELK